MRFGKSKTDGRRLRFDMQYLCIIITGYYQKNGELFTFSGLTAHTQMV